MNLSKLLFRRAAVAAAVCAAFFLIPAGRAQPAPQTGGTRYLFIFNTSADMKKRLPAVRTEVNQLLATSLGGRLEPGDSVGVWTFDQELHAGQFPLEYWNPDDAVNIASAINQFVGKQRYANRTRFDALQPQLNQIIQNSRRLTVLIFCDGEDEIKWTPYDDSINQVFRQRQAGQKKAAQPFVLVLRTQQGQFAGCTMNFPPGMVSVPEFPPLPAPLPPPAPTNMPPPAPPPAPAAAPPPTGPPLIIIGTKVMTNWPPASAPVPMTSSVPVAPANAAPPVPADAVAAPSPANLPPAVQTNAASAPARPSAPTNSATTQNPAPPPPANPAPVVPTNAAPPPANFAPAPTVKPVPVAPSHPTAATNAAASPSEESGPGHKWAFVIGGVLLIAGSAMGALAVFRHRRPDRGSLITRSMRKD